MQVVSINLPEKCLDAIQILSEKGFIIKGSETEE